MKKILILGGGFAGIQAAIELQKNKKFTVSLVSDRDYLFVFPISIWVPIHKNKFEDVKIPLAKIQKKYNFNVIIDKVTQIKSNEKKVICQNSILDYDYLVIAMGAEKLMHKGIQNTTTICGKPEQILDMQHSLDQLIAQGKGKIAIGFSGNPKDKSAVRGGPAFEFIFNLHNYLKSKKIRDNFELTFFAPMAEPGAKMGDGSLKMLDKMFDASKINKHFGKKIKEFENDGIVFEDNTKLFSDLTMFIAAGTGHSALTTSNLPMNDAGFIKINDFGQVDGFPEIFAIGDSAALESPDWVAKQGHIAEIMGQNTAFNIQHIEKGKNNLKGYKSHLNLLCIMDTGNGAAFVYRNNKRSLIIQLPIIGHWLKKAWGVYAKISKTTSFPRLPGM